MKNDKTDCAHYWVHAHSELINASKKCKRCGLEEGTKFHNVETTYWGLREARFSRNPRQAKQLERRRRQDNWQDIARKRGQEKRHGK